MDNGKYDVIDATELEDIHSCKTCKHNGKQMIYPSECTGCGDVETRNWEALEANDG